MPNPAIVMSKDEIKKMLSALMKQRTLVASVSNGKKLDYMPVADINDIIFDDELPYKSPKELFFPRCEKIMTFKDGVAVGELPEEQTVLFGVRPCDLEALAIMKKVFTQGKYKDPFFEKRYNNALIIGVGCVNKKPGCFCDERETDMGFCDKCDLFLGIKGDGSRADDGYEVLYVSDKGRDMLKQYITGLEKFENTKHKFTPVKTLSLEATEEDLFKKIDWENITEICQSCGVCTFVCPTCHCFMFKDVDEGRTAYRYKNWDSCMYPKFTMHASGHNPRTAKHERYRQRIAHKYSYVPENFGMVACTGCGRCIRSCSAGMNIKAVVEKIAETLPPAQRKQELK